MKAWTRLLERPNRIRPSDISLLLHERAELEYLRQHPNATYEQAHAYARERYPWHDGRGTESGTDGGHRVFGATRAPRTQL